MVLRDSEECWVEVIVLSDASDPQAFFPCFPLAQGYAIVAPRKHTWKKVLWKTFSG